MSNHLATFANIREELTPFSQSADLSLTAVAWKAVQFTIGSTYCTLNEAQCRQLIEMLQKRYTDKAYAATASDLDLYIQTDGTIRVE